MHLKMQKEDISDRLSKYEEKLKMDQSRQISVLRTSADNQHEKEIEGLTKREHEMKTELEDILEQVAATKNKILAIEKEKTRSEKEARVVAKLSASTISALLGSNTSSTCSTDGFAVNSSRKKSSNRTKGGSQHNHL